jgi:hypothetical protein
MVMQVRLSPFEPTEILPSRRDYKDLVNFS